MGDARFLRLSRVFAVLESPVTMPQAARLRRHVPRLPDAGGDWAGELEGPHPIRLVVFGDSTAAGVGVTRQTDALPGCLARGLVERTQRGVTWRAVGANGATSEDLRWHHLRHALADDFDVLFLTVGANDALGLRSRRAFRRDLSALLTAASARCPDAAIIVSCLPVFDLFDVLPEPLRGVLFRHTRSLEQVARTVVSGNPHWMMLGEPPPYSADFFADDGFHPSAIGCRDWADWALEQAWPLGLRESLVGARGAGSPAA